MVSFMARKINIKQPSEESYSEAAELMRKGEVVVWGSDGVYIMSCDPFNENSVKKLFALKRRASYQAFQLGLDPKDIDKYAIVNSWQKSVITSLLPDTISFIVENKSVPSFVTGPFSTICFGWQDNIVMQGLYRYFGGPFIGTSANIHGHDPAIRVEDVVNCFGDSIKLYIDSGITKYGIANTIIDLTQKPIRCLREGRYSINDINRLIREKGLQYD